MTGAFCPLDTSPLSFLHVSPSASLGEQGKRERESLPASLLVESSCPLHIQGLIVPHTPLCPFMPLPQVVPASFPLIFPPHLGSCQWLDNYQNSIPHCP